MKNLILVLSFIFIVMGCASTDDNTQSSAPADSTSTPQQASSESAAESEPAAAEATKPSATTPTKAGAIAIHRAIPYAPDNHIAGNIKSECILPTQLSDFIKNYGDEYGLDIVQKDTVAAEDPGKVLLVEIVDAVSSGNAWLGHRKYTEIKGTLYENGATVASFRAGRRSGGGAFAGYKGSCSVLGRTVKALGRDVANWLKSPVNDDTLGDL